MLLVEFQKSVKHINSITISNTSLSLFSIEHAYFSFKQENEAVYAVSIYYKPWESKSKKDDDDGTRHLEEKSDNDEKIYYNTIMNTRFKHLSSIISSQQHSGSSSSNIRKSNNISRRTLGYAAMTVEFIKCTFKVSHFY